MRVLIQRAKTQTDADVAVGLARSKGFVAFAIPLGKRKGFQVRIMQGLGKNPQAATTARLFGLDSLVEMAELSGKSTGTLKNWFRDEPQTFFSMLAGVVDLKARIKGGDDGVKNHGSKG